jgi:DNA-binding transcriptional MerR regulator
VAALLSIGDFSRATHLSVKALRHYDDVGLLLPADVDPATGYRFYAAAQVPAAQAIRRFRELDMPLAQIQAVLDAENPSARDRVILEHLDQMEAKLEQTQSTVASLRDLLAGEGASIRVELRTLPAVRALAIRERVSWDDIEAWLADAIQEVNEIIGDARCEAGGPEGALYTDQFFEAHDGDVIAFVPVRGECEASGRVRALDLPAGEFAVTVHQGPFSTLDTTYGALGTYVVERAIGVEGPIRENYLVTTDHTDDPADLRTEVCWPIRSQR